MKNHKCEVCGGPVKIVGETTKHYESLHEHLVRIARAEAFEEARRIILSMGRGSADILLGEKAKAARAETEGLGEK